MWLSNKPDIRFTGSTQKAFALTDFAITGNTVLWKHKIQQFPEPTQNPGGNITLHWRNLHNPSLPLMFLCFSRIFYDKVSSSYSHKNSH
jgi:hypothetical protein